MEAGRLGLWAWLCVAVGILSCAPKEIVPIDSRVRVDTATFQFLAMLQMRMQGHTVYPDHEIVLCLYGQKRLGVFVVESFRATRIRFASATTVHYDDCAKTRDYLGTVHTHLPADYNGDGVPEDACWFSGKDMQSFTNDLDAVLDLVVCGNGVLIGKLKR